MITATAQCMHATNPSITAEVESRIRHVYEDTAGFSRDVPPIDGLRGVGGCRGGDW